MATICYTKGGNKKSLLSLTEKITTPSIHIQKDGNHWYVPLFSGNKGSVIQSGAYIYTLGEFKVGSYRAAISREVAKCLVFWVDFNTRYIGTYSDNGSTITITDKTGNGTPYQQFCGFDPSLEGKSLTWDVISNGSSIKSRWVQKCSNIDNNPVIVDDINGDNIDGATPENHYGVKICEGWVPNGKYDLIFTVIGGGVTHKYYLHVVMNVPNNPGGSL